MNPALKYFNDKFLDDGRRWYPFLSVFYLTYEWKVSAPVPCKILDLIEAARVYTGAQFNIHTSSVIPTLLIRPESFLCDSI